MQRWVRAVGAVAVIVGAAVLTAATGGITTGWLQIACSAAIGFASGYTTAVINGSRPGDALRSGMMSGIISGAIAVVLQVVEAFMGDKAYDNKTPDWDNLTGGEQVLAGDRAVITRFSSTHQILVDVNGFRHGVSLLADLSDIVCNKLGIMTKTGREIRDQLDELFKQGYGPDDVIMRGHSLGSWDVIRLARGGYTNRIVVFGVPRDALSILSRGIPGVDVHLVFNAGDKVSKFGGIALATPSYLVEKAASNGVFVQRVAFGAKVSQHATTEYAKKAILTTWGYAF